MQKKPPNYLEMEMVINSPWIDTEGILLLLPIGKNKANKIRQEIEMEMEQNGEFYFKTKPRLIPTKKIIDKYFINEKLIRTEAAKLKK
jgi:hypothetical protein